MNAKQIITKIVIRIENQLNGLSYGFAKALFVIAKKLKLCFEIKSKKQKLVIE